MQIGFKSKGKEHNMPRPRKCRRVCRLPERNEYGPLEVVREGATKIIMTVEEYETIRLIDLESLTQEECAVHMKIARTTVQGLYMDARKKIAESIVNGKRILIQGGNYILCEGKGNECGRYGCNKYKI